MPVQLLSVVPGATAIVGQRAAGGGTEGLRAGPLDTLVNHLVKALRTTGIAESKVSRLCEEIDEWAGAFLARPLEGDWLYL